MTAALDHYRPQRVIDDLRALAELTGGPAGARRLCWTDEWLAARRFLAARLDGLPVSVETDEAGNTWARLEGARPETVVVGSHLDSVPNGGWLDGALGVMAGLEVLRAVAATGEPPPVTIRLVDWADEEGARFGRSLFGSSAVAGTLDPDAVRDLRGRDGERLADVLARYGVDVDRATVAQSRLRDVVAYFELHIEQGPVLEAQGLSTGVVLGTMGVERHRLVFCGQAGHAGSTPMDVRRDSLLAAARFALAVRDAAVGHGGVATTGVIASEPGVVTAIAGASEILLDLRHLDASSLAAMYADALDLADAAARGEGCTVEWHPLFQIPPIPFDAGLVEIARTACERITGSRFALPSGPLHDAAEMARLLPSVMVFASSTGGISHAKEEDTPEADLHEAIRVYAETVFTIAGGV